MATRTISSTGGNWSSTATWAEGAVPTADDDVVATGSSGNLTIDVTSACRSFDLTNYVNTVTHNAFTLTIGTSTAQASLVALAFPSSGWTYTLASVTTSAIAFNSSIASTIQTVNFGGKTTGNVTFTAATTSGYKLITSGFTTGTTATVSLAIGTLNTNNLNCSWGLFSSSVATTRTITLGSSTITLTGTGNSWNTATTTNLTITTNTATVIQSGAGVTFNAGGINYNGLSVQQIGSGATTIGLSGGTLANVTRTGTAVKTDTFIASGNFTVTGTLTITGNSVLNRILFWSSIGGTSRTITVNGSVVASNSDFCDIIGAGTASWDLSASTGGSGDALGNSGITFTAAVAQTWSGTAGGNWSTNAWTTRVPLPQDNVFVSSTFTGSPSIACDMPRLGKTIDWSASSGGTPNMSNNTINTTMYGSMTLRSGMTFGGGFTFGMWGRGTNTVTTNGVSVPVIQIGGGGATANYTMTDSITFASTATLTGGTATFNGNVTIATVMGFSINTVPKTLNMGSGTWSFNATTAITVWNNISAVAVTLNPGTSTMVIANPSANTRTFVGGGSTYNALTYSVASSSGALVITGANSFNTLTVGGGRTLTLPIGVTTIGSAAGWQVSGASGSVVTINSATNGAAATVSCASGIVSADYLLLQDSAATGGASWYAGANSTSVSNVTGWNFSAAPANVEYWGRPL